MREAKKGEVELLYDTGATVSLIKKKYLKEKTPAERTSIKLTGVTGHQASVIGKITATIRLKDKNIKHPVYVVRDDFPVSYQGILRNDFMKKHNAKPDSKAGKLSLGKNKLQLRPYKNVKLQPCNETIVQAVTDSNQIGIVQGEETQPGVFIGSCLVQPKGNFCPVSIVNTTEKTVTINTPRVKLETLEEEMVPKKMDASGVKKLKIVVDFRRLNEATIGDSFPLPNIAEILDQLGNAKYFSTLDLASGYHQIPMDEENRGKTAFSTPHGHYKYNRMPFGLKNAPATLQRLMNSVLMGLRGYIGGSVENKGGQEISSSKKSEGYTGVHWSGRILQKIYQPGLKNRKPLTRLLQKEVAFEWGHEQQQAFENLKEKLIIAPLLAYPDFDKEFIVTTDVSSYAVGAVLSQGAVGRDRPVAYASRVLNKAERNYSTTKKELLAIVWAVKHFRPYLYRTKFKIVTDHKALVWLFNTTAYHPESNGALKRLHRTLAEYIRHYVNKDQTDWDDWVPYAMFAYNTTPHTATGFTPFELVYGSKHKKKHTAVTESVANGILVLVVVKSHGPKYKRQQDDSNVSPRISISDNKKSLDDRVSNSEYDRRSRFHLLGDTIRDKNKV
ncbi:uncharacterized protein LOC109862121 [Pseudomyrmex gracilis]|uniref:uncharacterized protein LOC109862121 n=1 Tax=Pseudomyrmex gracilis TaxID=219809 RepID=UPI0009955FA6|nr:uncharacterized protein LOC109862121 [Pseudomyrmex gracilis]